MAKIKCPSCGTKFSGNFCPNCSAPAPEIPKKKKGWLIPVIVIALIVLVVACSGGSDDEDVKQPSGSNQTSQTGQTGSTETADSNETGNNTQTEEVTVSEQEIYNAGGITITAKSLSNGLFGPEISVTVSNDSDKNVTISSRDLSVNGYMMSLSGLYCDVAAGKKANDTITLYNSELKEAGIDTIADVEFYVHIYDSDSWEGIADSDLLKVTTSVSGTYVQPIDDSGEEIYNANGIRVVCQGLKSDLIWDGVLVFYIENNSSQPITVTTENLSVNGFMESESMWSDLRPGTRMVDGMYILNMDDLGLNSLDDVENIEFNLRIINSDTWGEIDTSDVISLDFN